MAHWSVAVNWISSASEPGHLLGPPPVGADGHHADWWSLALSAHVSDRALGKSMEEAMPVHFLPINRRGVFAAVAASVLLSPGRILAEADPLPSWNEGAAKQTIVDFVSKVTKSDSADFVAPERRIATFDNDGTLWSEQPLYFQMAFALDRIKQLAPRHPEWKTTEPFRSVLAHDKASLAKLGANGLLQIVETTHSGMTVEAFQAVVLDWLATARHPRFNRPYTDLVYQPMLELLSYLRSNGFKTFIVSGGGIEFMRPWVEKVYGIPPEQVVGSSGAAEFRISADGRAELVKLPRIEFIDDGPGKPVAINRFIGRRPILAFGNSDGDQQMLEWSAAGSGGSLQGLVHHTDAAREWAYDRTATFGKLDKAWDEATRRGWLIVDMKRDWKVVYPFDKP
jgi:phosphoglycolate phosphatase-like HAD superfamily hydrolase